MAFGHKQYTTDSGVLEAMYFWFVVALLESGLTEQARDILGKYQFSDERYYFWIIMGATFIEKILPVSRQQKDIARNIREVYQGSARDITRKFFREFKDTVLLEMRGEKVVEVAEERVE